MKISVAIAGALLVVSAVAGCGAGSGSDSKAYCNDIKKADKDFNSFAAGDLTNLDKAFATFHSLAGEAPATLKKDWAVLDGAVTTMEKAFKDAGIEFSDLADLQKGNIPAGVDTEKLTQLSTTMSKFTDVKFKAASDNIAKHAKDICKVDLAG